MGLSILSGGHAEVVPDVLQRLREAGAGDIPVVVGGIIPPADAGLRPGGGRRLHARRLRYHRHRRPHRRRDPPAPAASSGDDNRRVTRAEMTTAPTAPSAPPPRRRLRAAPVLPGRAGQQPAVPGEGPGPARGPGVPGPGGRLRAAGEGERPAPDRRRAEHRGLDRQDPRRPGQRLDHAVDLPGRDHGGRGRRREPGLRHAAEGAGRRAGGGAGPAADPDREDDGLRGRPDRDRGPDRERPRA